MQTNIMTSCKSQVDSLQTVDDNLGKCCTELSAEFYKLYARRGGSLFQAGNSHSSTIETGKVLERRSKEVEHLLLTMDGVVKQVSDDVSGVNSELESACSQSESKVDAVIQKCVENRVGNLVTETSLSWRNID